MPSCRCNRASWAVSTVEGVRTKEGEIKWQERSCQQTKVRAETDAVSDRVFEQRADTSSICNFRRVDR